MPHSPSAGLAPDVFTSRLRLRAPHPADLRSLHEALTDPANLRFGTESTGAAARLAHWQALWAADGFGPWAVQLREHPEWGAIGFGGLSRALVTGVPSLLLEFHFRSDFWGCGYAAEMSLAALQMAFRDLKSGEVQSLLPPGNTAARKTVERLGLRLKGSVADHPGEAASLLYEINVAQFQARPPQQPEPTPFGA
ncbi:GNAT family N-acetyltransferase [Roseateles sp. SL47]|uniref:GNAT family N-acetyltransferase n=1 Tax=Roseateles sp. SL47 TaxID=2995138 RepID=UPI002271B191|nr:GNAT family N-acetyltransferase [Roseateles sp. SL47]WAC72951.1 GNAT family N-acetyltransferase [Roseateles sp. SL47]